METELQFLPGDEADRTRIDLWIAASAEQAIVVLYDDDPARAERVWEEAIDTGGFPLTPLDTTHYGPVALSLGRIPDRPTVAMKDFGERSGFRYEFTDGRIVSARASGNEADLQVGVSARDDIGCEFEAMTGLRSAVSAWCESMGSVLPFRVEICTIP